MKITIICYLTILVLLISLGGCNDPKPRPIVPATTLPTTLPSAITQLYIEEKGDEEAKVVILYEQGVNPLPTTTKLSERLTDLPSYAKAVYVHQTHTLNKSFYKNTLTSAQADKENELNV